MTISYDKLWKLLIDKKISASEMRNSSKYYYKNEKRTRSVTNGSKQNL